MAVSVSINFHDQNTACGAPILVDLSCSGTEEDCYNVRLGVCIETDDGHTQTLEGAPNGDGECQLDISSALRAMLCERNPFAVFFANWSDELIGTYFVESNTNNEINYTLRAYAKWTQYGEEKYQKETQTLLGSAQYVFKSPLQRLIEAGGVKDVGSQSARSAQALSEDLEDESKDSEEPNNSRAESRGTGDNPTGSDDIESGTDATRDCVQFAFLTSEGTVDCRPFYPLETCQYSVRKDEFKQVAGYWNNQIPTLLSVCRESRVQWLMSSGYTNRETAGYLTRELFTSRRVYMLCTPDLLPGMGATSNVWLPVIITPKSNDVTIYERSKAEAIEVSFTVKSAI